MKFQGIISNLSSKEAVAVVVAVAEVMVIWLYGNAAPNNNNHIHTDTAKQNMHGPRSLIVIVM